MAYTPVVPSVMTADDVAAACNSLPGSDVGTVSATAGAATLSKLSGTVTSESLSTAAGSAYTLTITNTKVTANSVVTADAYNGSNTGGQVSVASVTPAAGSLVIVVKNDHASTAFNGTIKVMYAVLG